ncbi:sensor histidine kinase [Maricaulis parjimensis]|uniref:sensor histidine kinase n=1 Tax=Maricaulis parjimensis TaxID=144023 RepID=UPI001939F220|nr:histidine kinase [Maricaulis parjimensis]
MRFLSPHQPWLYLIYLVLYFLPWFHRVPEQTDLVSGLLAIGLFLALFFVAMIRRDWTALPAAGLVLVMAYVLMPANPGAAVLVIYAAAMLGRMRQRQLMLAGLFAWAAGLAAGNFLLGLPWTYLAGFLAFGGLVMAATAWSAAREDREAMQEELQAEAAASAVEAERQRIARDLHDLLGHTLSVVTLKAEIAQRLFDADPERARSELGEIETISRNALGEVREAVTGLRRRSLSEAAEETADRLRSAGLDVTLTLEAMDDLPDVQQQAIRMMLREGATNILRHAQAKRADIRLRRAGESINVSLLDDGVGGARYAGRGLDDLRDRLCETGLDLVVGPGIDGQGSGLIVRSGQPGEAS